MKKLLITNLVYGDIYANIFLNYHLKSLLDPTNIPSFKDRIEYIVFTDHDTEPKLEAHEGFKLLKKLIPVDVVTFLPSEFKDRYSHLIFMFKESVKYALNGNQYLSAMVADLVVAQGYIGKLFDRLDSGFDSVFVLPMRTAWESMSPILNKQMRALPALELGMLGFENLHPLWVACHWDSPQFTKLPFSLLWNSGTGLLVRSFSITPIAFVPTPEMQDVRGVIDVDVPPLCKNPYWATDWTDCPVMGIEPLFCYYPPFANHMANAKLVGSEWTKCLNPGQLPLLKEKLYYPTKEHAMVKPLTEKYSDTVVKMILENVGK